MKKFISFAMATAMMAGSMQFGYAEDAVTTSASSSSSVSSEKVKPCMDKTGLAKALCMTADVQKNRKSESPRQNSVAHERNALCKFRTGADKAQCLRKAMVTKTVTREDRTKKVTTRIKRHLDTVKGKEVKELCKDVKGTDRLKCLRGDKSVIKKSSSSSSVSSTSSSSSSISSSSSSSSSAN